jgi:N-acetylmuramoyl-L-alanine amidase
MRRLAAWLALLALVALFAACDGASTPPTAGDRTKGVESSAPAPEASATQAATGEAATAEEPSGGRASAEGAGNTAAADVPASATPAAAQPAPTEAPATPVPSPTPVAPAARQGPVVVLDPGHGSADDPGAAAGGVVEKTSNFDMARRVEALLVANGVTVVLTRQGDTRATGYPAPTGTRGFSASRLDLQARVDLANAQGADLFLSIHSNGSSNAGERGIEVWYDPNRPFSRKNEELARLVLEGSVASLRAAGFEARDRGLKDDTCFRNRDGRCFPLFLLGPPRETTREEVLRRGGDPDALGFGPGQESISTRATTMPAALVELLFISNADDNVTLQNEAARDAMARGVASAILRYLAGLEPAD